MQLHSYYKPKHRNNMKESIRVVQISHPEAGRRVAMVKEPSLVVLNDTSSVYKLAFEVLEKQEKMEAAILSRLSDKFLDIMRFTKA